MVVINLKNATELAYEMLSEASAIRGLTHAEYVEKLAHLHEVCRAIADAGDDRGSRPN
jgi:hypothetical protein